MMAEILVKPDEVPAGKIPVSVEGGFEWQDAPTGGGGGMTQHANEWHDPDMALATELAAHTGAPAPHSGHETPAGAQAKVDAHAGLVTAHAAATNLEKTANKGAINGYAGLDAGSKVPTVNLGGAGADATKYLRGDQSWQVPPGGAGGDGEVTVVMLADVPNATVNLADAVGLQFAADANSTYIIEAFLVWNSSATAVGIKVSATATNSPTIMSGHFICDAANGTPDGSTYNANDVVVTTSASPFTTGNLGQLAAVLKTGVSASTWKLRFAAETTGTITLRAGSTIRYRKVA